MSPCSSWGGWSVSGILLVATILFWNVAFDAVAYRWPKPGRLIKAQPRLLIKDGEVNPQVVRRELMTRDVVLSQLRLHGIEDLAEVERAYIEPNGWSVWFAGTARSRTSQSGRRRRAD